MSDERRTTLSDVLGGLVMEFHTGNRIFVNAIAKRERERSRRRTLKWYLTIGISELGGTAILLFVTCMGALPTFAEVLKNFQVSLIAGSAVFITCQAFGHISGSHINPMITIAAMFCKLVSIPTALFYIAAQFVGALLGYWALVTAVPRTWLFDKNSTMEGGHRFCVTVPNPILSTTQAFLFEFLADFIFVITCWALWEKRSQNSLNITSIKLGFTIFGLVLAFGDFTGPSLNTVRSFAPAVFTGVWTLHWVYWVAPVCAAVTGSVYYKLLFHNFRNLDEDDENDR